MNIPDNALTISVFLVGNKYCAVFTESFKFFAEDYAGFGDTRTEAVKNLLEDVGYFA